MHRRRSAPCRWNLCTNTKADHDGEGVAQSRVLFHDKRSLHVMKRGRFVSAIISCTPVKYTSPWTRDAMLPKSVMVTIRERGELLLISCPEGARTAEPTQPLPSQAGLFSASDGGKVPTPILNSQTQTPR